VTALAEHVRGAFEAAEQDENPYRHWNLTQVLPEAILGALDALPFEPPPDGDNRGRRENANSSRTFFSAEARARLPVCGEIADAFQAPATIRTIERRCGARLDGTSLRIEYCQDREGFWLEPHTDIGAKLFTMLIYLSISPDAVNWGTDILDGPEGGLVTRASGARNTGLIFIPAADTWHGFAPRPIAGVRRTLIVNYVRDTWRARHELAFPEEPVVAA